MHTIVKNRIYIMEVLFGIVLSGCFGFLVTEMNTMQSDLKKINQDIYEIKCLIHKKRKSDIE